MQVELSGILNGVCDTCLDFNDTYILSQTEVNPCVWRYDFEGGGYIQLHWVDQFIVAVPLVSECPGQTIELYWSIILGDRMNCDFEGSLSLSPSGFQFGCDPSASTCTVSVAA
jgi:hypothetical protein